MNIVFHLPKLSLGGVAKNTLALSNEFLMLGHKVTIIVHDLEGEFIDYVDSRINVINLKTKNIFTAIPKIRKVIRQNNYDLLISSRDLYNSIILLTKKIFRLKINIMVTCRTDAIVESKLFKNKSRKVKTKIYMLLAKFTYRWANSIVAVSEGVKISVSSYSKIPLNKIVTIYNPIIDNDFERKKVENVTESIFNDPINKVVISAGRFVEQKNFPLLINAFSNAYKQDKNLRLQIFGEGEEKANLQKLINDLNIQEVAQLNNFVPNVIKYIKRSEIFVLSSNWEGFGNVLAEALGCGIKIVSTNCPSGPAEILENGDNGTLTKPDNLEELTTAILVNINKQVDSSKLIQKSLRFSSQKIAMQYMDTYEKSCN